MTLTPHAATKTASAFAPATVANVAVGFDCLGFAFSEIGDVVHLDYTASRGVELDISITEIRGIGGLPLAADKNTATLALSALCAGQDIRGTFRLRIDKGIPLSSGLGGSAASAVAAVFAANAVLDLDLADDLLLDYALAGEAVTSGAAHADNVAPCLLGGMTLIFEAASRQVVQLPIPQDLFSVLVHPAVLLETKGMRSALAEQVPLTKHVDQSACLAAFVAACFREDFALLGDCMQDLLIAPQRGEQIPCFEAACAAAKTAGALGVSISGSGPSLFALAEGRVDADRVGAAFLDCYTQAGHHADVWVAKPSHSGARLLSDP